MSLSKTCGAQIQTVIKSRALLGVVFTASLSLYKTESYMKNLSASWKRNRASLESSGKLPVSKNEIIGPKCESSRCNLLNCSLVTLNLDGQGTLRPFEFCFNIEKSKIKFCPIFVFAFVISQTNFKILTRFSFFHFKIKQTKIKHSLPFLLFTFLLFRLFFSLWNTGTKFAKPIEPIETAER